MCSIVLSIASLSMMSGAIGLEPRASRASGLEQYFWFSNQSELSSDVISRQASSYDRTDGNGDSARAMGFNDSSTGVVLLECDGPGVITRIWCGGHVPIRFYFYIDGAETPVVNMTIEELTSGLNYPFVKPLVGGMKDSSGGYYSYLPIPFAKSIKIVADYPGYYNINYQKYPAGSKIVSFTGQENVDSLVDIMQSLGENPGASGHTETKKSGDLENGQTMSLFESKQGGAVNEIKLNIPQLAAEVSDDKTCRDYQETSEYILNINPENDGVALKKLMDISQSGPHKVTVSVDGEMIGDWKHSVDNVESAGQIETFYIPPQYTAGKSSIRVKTEMKGVISNSFTNEYYIEAYCLVDGFYAQTDHLDVGDEEDEGWHEYHITGDQRKRNAEVVLNTGYNFEQNTKTIRTENGRAHKGSSKFTVNIDPNNEQVRVVKLLDRYSKGQKWKLYVDDTIGGIFTVPTNQRDAIAFPHPTGINNAPFYEMEMNIPSNKTQGKSSVDLCMEYAAGSQGVNEYCYRIYSLVSDRWVLTDTLDVGDVEDELLHGYEITEQTWNGVNTYDYFVADQWITEKTRQEKILDGLYVRVTCDDMETPTVDAPAGAFFGVGQIGLDQNSMLMFGLDEENTLYFYFQQPYRSSCKVELVNRTGIRLTGLSSTVVSDPTFVFTDLTGYLKGQYHDQTTESTAEYFSYLETEGSGHLVAVVNTDIGSLTSERDYVECDESFFVDRRRDFAGNGTGKEDMYNGSLCFEYGTFACPLHANSFHDVVNYGDGPIDRTVMVRTFLSDRIHFRDGMQMLMECYFAGERQKTLSLYYHRSEPAMVKTDVLDASNETSLSDHAYQAMDSVPFSDQKMWPGYYQGDLQTIQGLSVASSSFTVSIDPENNGVVIYRTFSHTADSADEDCAVISADGISVGVWTAENVSMGNNELHRLGSDAIVIPSEITKGKDKITIEMQTEEGKPWHDVYYEVFSLRDAEYTCGDVDNNGKIDASDALQCLQYVVALRELGTIPQKAADVNLDKVVDTTDALGILQYTVDIVRQLPIQ